ncbi:MAG: hypothetical protein JXR91_12980, partial [Deltaproteobacteria bacterium]|nr:hypothetical protein [Deltaproteobacteria bacterium]
DDLWLYGNSSGLTKATWNSATQTYSEKSLTPDVSIWDSSFYITDMSSSKDGTEIYLYALKNTDPDKAYIIKVADIDTATPKFTLINTDNLSLSQSGIISAFDSNNIYYGASYGYIAKYDGDKWNLISNDITSGFPIEPYVTADNSIYTASRRAVNDKLHVYSQETWDNHDLPDDLIASAIYPVTEDNIWVFGANGTTYHYDLSKWTSVDIGTSIEGAVTNVYGTADDDIWAVGYDKISNYEQSLILHYDGKKWTRKKDMEKITGGAITAIDGTAFDNVYIATKFGTLFHFDGNEWSKVVQKLFSDPSSGDDELGVCSATPVADLQTWCTGNGSGMSIYLDVARDGTLFTGKNYGGYSVLTGTAANCPAEQPNRCIFIAADENWSDYPASFNGTTWKPIPLPSYSQYTGSDKKVFHMGIMGVDENTLYTSVGALNLGDPDNATYEILFWNGSKWEALPEQPGTVGIDFDAPISSLIGSQKGEITAFSINYLVIIPLKGTPTSKMVSSSQIMKYESCSF